MRTDSSMTLPNIQPVARRKKLLRTISLTCVLLALLLVVPQISTISPMVQGRSFSPISSGFCFIDLANNTFDNQATGAISFVLGPSGGQAVVKINLNPAQSGFSRALVSVNYSSTPTNWTLNIGDSSTNDGFGGDAGTQSNDAEMQINGDTLSVYLKQASVTPNVLNMNKVVNTGQTITLEVKNNFLGWGAGNLNSENLYALAGQADSEGPVNWDVFAGFNHVVRTTSTRTGTGVGWALIQVLP